MTSASIIALELVRGCSTMWSLPFDLPELPWWGWAIVALTGAFFAWFISRFQNKYTSFIAVVLAVLATLSGLLAMYVWAASS